MNKPLFLAFLLITQNCFSQCPFQVSLDSTGNCVGATLNVNTTSTASKIVWYNNNTVVKTVTATAGATSGETVAGGNGIGVANNQFADAQDVYLDAYGNIYVCDDINSRILKFPLNSNSTTSGVIVAGGNGLGNAANQLYNPDEIFIDAKGNLFVADEGNDRIQEFSSGSTSSTNGITVAGGNGLGTALNQFDPTGLYVDPSGNIYISDAQNNRVLKWAPGATSGIVVAGGNGAGSAANQLDLPYGIFVDNLGAIYIVDARNYRVQKWVAGATSGITVAGGNGQGSNQNQLQSPGDIYVAANGNVYVSDAGNNRVQKWMPGATSGIVVAGGNGGGSAPNQLAGPDGIYLNANGDLYIVDYINQRIQKWAQSFIDTSYTVTSTGSYTAVVTDSNGCSVTTNSVVINTAMKPQVTILSSDTSICTNAAVTFTATPLNAGINPVYQWQANSINVGSNSATYSSSTLSNGSEIRCILNSSNTACSTLGDTSNTIVITVGDPLTPAVSISASQTTICSGTSVIFLASASNRGASPVYQWKLNGGNVGDNRPDFISNNFSNGDVISCVMTSSLGCTTSPTATSNSITMQVNADAPTVSISSSATEICSGDPVTFTAEVTNATSGLSYEWQINGVDERTDNTVFTNKNFSDGDTIKCIVKTNGACNSLASNSIVLKVDPTPSVNPKTISITPGQSITLDPSVTGNVVSYAWSPATYLSNIIILNPVASPPQSIVYTLQVAAADGCKASGNITVKVFTQLSVPNVFTPNGDGRNDIFYMLGGQQGSIIKDFSVFNRWGQMIFQARNIQPDDPSVGWNGYYNGLPAPTGTYVYIITMILGNGEKKIFKGSVELIR